MRRIGVVVHGPEIIDSGWAKKIIEILEKKGKVKAKLGGTMGRTAVIDASLEDKIDISEKLKPSESIKRVSKDTDEIYLLNYGKSNESGDAFGTIVTSHVGEIDVPVVQIDMGGDGRVIPLTHNSIDRADEIGVELGIEVKNPVEKRRIVKEDGRIHRIISGVFPKENILLNGIVIGRAEDENLEIITEKKRIIGIKGGKMKEHGIKKLGEIDLETATIKTGKLRRTKINPRVLKGNKNGKAVMIFHRADSSFEIAMNVDVAVTVGDDTTEVAGDVLRRLDIPIIGITDGDLDDILDNACISPKSTIIRVREGKDDEVGRRIMEEIFGNEEKIDIASVEELKDHILKIVKDDIETIEKYG
jgi:hypothetical protein